jgi:periplasmic protein TonB
MALRTTVEVDSQESFGPPMAKSFGLHALLAALIIGYTFLSGRFHGAEWGNNRNPGAIQATLVSSAPSIPLPQDTPPTPNVLATEQPSPAPAPPQPKAEEVPPPEALPIPVKAPPKPKPEKKPTPPAPQHAQPQPIQHRAQYGEAPATQIPHSMAADQTSTQPVSVEGGGQGFNYPYYVGIIQRKVRESWYTREAGTAPVGSQVHVTFSISRDGTPSDIRISHSSGVPSLDSSALRAVQRVDSFGPLPPGYNKSSVSVEYTFTYDQPAAR